MSRTRPCPALWCYSKPTQRPSWRICPRTPGHGPGWGPSFESMLRPGKTGRAPPLGIGHGEDSRGSWSRASFDTSDTPQWVRPFVPSGLFPWRPVSLTQSPHRRAMLASFHSLLTPGPLPGGTKTLTCPRGERDSSILKWEDPHYQGEEAKENSMTPPSSPRASTPSAWVS